jgi:hypothetical protein
MMDDNSFDGRLRLPEMKKLSVYDGPIESLLKNNIDVENPEEQLKIFCPSGKNIETLRLIIKSNNWKVIPSINEIGA